jgi:ERF superfamily
MTEKTKDIKVAEQTVPVANTDTKSVDSFITLALSNNAPIETLERLFALHKEVEAEKAKSAYVRAMADFQKDCPVIEKKKKVMNKDGRTVRYVFAPLEDIVAQIKDVLGRNGLSYTWTIENTPQGMTANAKVTHVQGHSETSSFTVPIDTEGFMTAPQKHAAAQTFAKRYALCNVLGISTGDEDTDASTVNEEKTAKSPKAKIVFALRRLGKEGKTKEETVANIKELTQLEPIDENTSEILSRLELLVTEKEEYDNSQV